jgi:fructose-1,6-bisphosphatase I
VNEAYAPTFPDPYRKYLEWAHASGYSSRYIGSMVADVHRTLLTGGVFMYPPTKKNPEGKLRYLYEASPMAFIMEQAGGLSFSGANRTLEYKPSKVHERVPVLLGSRNEVERVRSFGG